MKVFLPSSMQKDGIGSGMRKGGGERWQQWRQIDFMTMYKIEVHLCNAVN